MTLIRCKLRIEVDDDPEKAKMLRELAITPNDTSKRIMLLDTLLNVSVLRNSLMVFKTETPTIAVQFLGNPTLHFEYEDDVWKNIQTAMEL
jgi:hypothetical protein